MATNKRLETILYSAIGVAAVLLLLIALNFILSLAKVRLDLTEEKAFTLSKGTKAILAKLDTPVTIRFYYSQRESMMPVPLKTYAQRVEDLLSEYKQASKGKVTFEKYDPEPDSDAEDSAKLDGVEGQPIQTGEVVYLGLAIKCADQVVGVPFLSPDRERLLEYDVSRAIATVTKPEKPVIGVMTALPMFGAPMNPMMMRMGQQGSQPWYFVNELKRDFTVKQVELAADKIDDDIKVLVAVHPKDLSEKTQFALDQFILRGGKLIAFLDPRSTVDSRNQPGGIPGMGGASSSSLGKLLETWGLQFDTSKCVADMQYVTSLFRGRGDRPEPAPAVLSLTEEAVNKDDVTTSQIDSLLMWAAGGFTGTPAEGLKQTVLLKSSKQSQLVDSFTAEMAGEQIRKDFKPSGKEYALALRLTGKFKTAFPNGAPEEKKPEGADAEKKDEKKPETKPSDALKESKSETSVILVGDSDMLYDQFCVQVQEFFGQQIATPRNANITFAQSLIEQLAGDSNLIAVRSRASLSRPFTLVKKIQAQAEDEYRARIKGLEDSLQETQKRLGELQQNKEKGQRFILSPEQKAEIENFRKKEAQANKELKLVRKSLRQDVDALENRLKWMNIAGMPFAVTLTGVTLAFLKRKRTAAR
jgi:ABC-type uncharacterized transport system involved in gliding motility auxiliary subunit